VEDGCGAELPGQLAVRGQPREAAAEQGVELRGTAGELALVRGDCEEVGLYLTGRGL